MYPNDSRRGIALILTLSIVLVVGLLVLGSSVMGVIDRSASANQYRSNAAYYLALTGIDAMKTVIFNNLVETFQSDGALWCASPVEDGIWDGDGNLVFARGEWYSGVGEDGGTYRVSYGVFGSILVVESVGEFGNATSRVRLVASSGAGPASAWDNAITAQGRPTEKAIAGNVSVYGSVHIVRGDIEEVIDGSLDAGGTAGIYSDYFGNGVANSDIRARITDLVDTEVDLCARVKIARGNIYAAGNVELGIDGSPESRQLYSLHLGDGVVCNRNRQSCNPNNPNHVVTDHNDSNRIWLRNPESGMSLDYEPFDLSLPRLNARAFDADEVFMVRQPVDEDDPLATCSWLYDGDEVRLPPSDPSADSDLCGDGGNTIQWLAADGGHLSISGRVNITDADLVIHAPVNYAGSGAILVGDGQVETDLDEDGDEIVTVNLEPGNIFVGASIRPLGFQTYLQDGGNEMALLATRDITFDVAANDPPSGVLLYAGRDFISQKQGIIVGAVVAERFDMKQVPKIAYHPDVRFAAERLWLPGTASAEGGIPQNAGILANIAIERY